MESERLEASSPSRSVASSGSLATRSGAQTYTRRQPVRGEGTGFAGLDVHVDHSILSPSVGALSGAPTTL